MRTCRIWRDSDQRVYAEDCESGQRFSFLDVANLFDNPGIRRLVATELLHDLYAFSQWLNGGDPNLERTFVSPEIH